MLLAAMSERWRFIDGGPTEAPMAFGRLPAIAGGIAQGGAEVLMTMMWTKGHFQIGWFDDVDAVINMEAAREAGVDVFRRPVWGGGTAFYDRDAVAIWSWLSSGARFGTLDAALEFFRPAMTRVLEDLGLGEARFEGSSDIRFQGRKLGTLMTQDVMGIKAVGGFLNMRRPDLDLYRKVARVPDEKFKDKIIKDIVEYICTPVDIRGRPITYEEFRDAVVRASKEVLELDLEATPFTAEEEANASQFVGVVSAPDWINRISSARFRAEAPPGARVGFANHKAKKLIRACVALREDGTIARAMMAGDMHISPPDAMDRVSTALAGVNASDRDDLVARVRGVFEQQDIVQADAAVGITPEDCVEAVLLAAKNAQ
jgi:lipoate-protein ligase A